MGFLLMVLIQETSAERLDLIPGYPKCKIKQCSKNFTKLEFVSHQFKCSRHAVIDADHQVQGI